jgi:hypothetical protein
MTPPLLAEYIAAVGLTLSGLFWINMVVAAFAGVFDREPAQEKDDE